jgi:exoribonuclease R
VPARRLATPHREEFAAGFARIRAALGIEDGYPEAALAEADAAAARGPTPPPGRTAGRVDRRDLPLVTIDPEGSTDLDQAVLCERRGDGYRVSYAIADVAAFVAPGGVLDEETRRRGVTLYAPDERIPLHPPALSEHAASLLPDGDRPALLWTLDLDEAGAVERARFEPATVRSRAKLSYAEAQRRIDAGTDPALTLLRAVGELRLAAERDRGAVSLELPEQEVEEHRDADGGGDGHFRLVYRAALPVEHWNAQISLLTGMTAASMMLDAGVGLLRTLPPPDDETVAALRRAAGALGIPWAEGVRYADRIRSLDPGLPGHAALLHQAARLLRGAGYVAFSGDRPPAARHAAIAAHYAHVTAPLRRLADRFANEVLVAVAADATPPSWALDALPAMPELMADARRREGALDRAVVDLVEAVLLRDRVGEEFDATVVTRDDRRARVLLADPAVIADVGVNGELEPGALPAGTRVRLRLVAADPANATVRFEAVAP